MRELILFPFNGNAKEAVGAIEAVNQLRPTWKVLGFIDDDPRVFGRSFAGYPVLGGRVRLDDFPQASLLAVPGRPENYHLREQVIQSLGIPHERFATVVHPSAVIGPECAVGYNTLLLAGVVATAQVTVGNHCVVLPNSVLSHDVRVDDHCLIGSNVSISGGVHLESNCYVGTGARIISGLSLGTRSLIGMGAVLLRSTPPHSMVVGNPGRTIPNRFLAG